MRATAIPALAAVVNPESPFDCDCVCCVDGSDAFPKPSLIVLLSGTVILQTHYWLPRDDQPFRHSHESINVQRNFVRVTDSDLVFRGGVKASARVRHKLSPLRVTADSKALRLGLTVDCDLVFVWQG